MELNSTPFNSAHQQQMAPHLFSQRDQTKSMARMNLAGSISLLVIGVFVVSFDEMPISVKRNQSTRWVPDNHRGFWLPVIASASIGIIVSLLLFLRARMKIIWIFRVFQIVLFIVAVICIIERVKNPLPIVSSFIGFTSLGFFAFAIETLIRQVKLEHNEETDCNTTAA